MTKVCTKCNSEQPLDNFHKCNRRKDRTHQYWCKSCQANWKKINKVGVARSVKKARNKIVAAKQKWVATYLETNHCPCGEARRCCLQFDHVDPSTKKDDIGRLVRSGCSLATLQAEVAKTRVLCANCHCVRTSFQFGWYLKKVPNPTEVEPAPLHRPR